MTRRYKHRARPRVGEVWETVAGRGASKVLDAGDRLRTAAARRVTLQAEGAEPREISLEALLSGWRKQAGQPEPEPLPDFDRDPIAHVEGGWERGCRCLACSIGHVEIRHGGAWAYRRGCRCDPCKEGNSSRHRAFADGYAARVAAHPRAYKHGLTLYNNARCRCRTCCRAKSKALAAERARAAERRK